MMQQQHNPMMSPGPMNMAPPMGMSPQHVSQQMPAQHVYEQPMHSPQQQPMYHQPAPAPQKVVYEQAPMPQQVRFEPAPVQAECTMNDRSPQQRPMEPVQHVQEEFEMPKVITAPSAPPCQLGGFREFLVEETRPVQQVMER